MNSPIIISWDGTQVELTAPEFGKLWTFYPNQPPLQLSWLSPNSTAGFLALDRNGNGIIDDATELFGNITEQETPVTGRKNGFNALREFDLNNDGVIDSKDAVFSSLLLWMADGTLHKLTDFGVIAISLDYSPANFTDQWGNRAGYKSIVTTTASDDKQNLRYAGDWYLVYAACPNSESK